MAVPVLAPPRHLPPPGATLPRGRERLRTGTAVSMALHALVLLVVLWQTTDIFGGGGHGSGPRGGGGGGGRPAVTWFTLPPPSGPTVAVDVPALPAVAVSDLPVPDPVQLNLPQLTVPHDISPTTPVGRGPGQSGGTGNGPGNGGGTGTGTGPGTGSDVGPGTGGEGDYIQRADLRGSILPPQCMRGRYTVRFWVAADGHVSRVEVTPTLRDGGCRQEMQERMMGYRFRPALNLNGRPVPDIRDITVSH